MVCTRIEASTLNHGSISRKVDHSLTLGIFLGFLFSRQTVQQNKKFYFCQWIFYALQKIIVFSNSGQWFANLDLKIA